MNDDSVQKKQDYVEKSNFEFVKTAHAEWLEGFKGVKEFSTQAFRMLYILNGGALIALLALLGNMYGKVTPKGTDLFQTFIGAITPAFMPFVSGLILAGLASVFAYLNFSALEYTNPDAGQLLGWLRKEKHELSNRAQKASTYTARIAFVFGLASLGAFGFGCFRVYQAFILLGAG